jgi:O-acetyl-ADP-ribose deacetylase (regulator of RNase III)
MTITYLSGSATQPVGPGLKIISHVCNDIGGWGRGFVLAVSKDHPAAESAYRSWYQRNPEWEEISAFRLGAVQFVPSKPDIWVANMISQLGIFPRNGLQPIRYDALHKCLKTVAQTALDNDATVHMPRIGCGLAGGNWENVEKVIEETMVGVNVFVYDYEASGPEVIPWNK